MKKIYSIGLLAALIILFSSCEKVIDINLNDAAKKYVIEGVLTNQPGSTTTVSITQTKNFSEDNTFPGISGAQVTIVYGTNTVTLTETTPGIYTTNAINGTVGTTYNLTVKVGGETFTSSSTMPVQKNLDSIYVKDQNLFGDIRKMVSVMYVDPPGKGDGYRFLQYVNGVKEKSIFVMNDDLTDNRPVDRVLFTFNDDEDDDQKKIKSGDLIRIQMQCIDEAVYKYWYSMDIASTGENQQATPANPVSNIKGGALGYFSAHTVQEKTMIVP